MKSILRWLVPVWALAFFSFSASAQCDTLRLAHDSLQWVVAGAGNMAQISSMEQYNDTLYFGGSFKYIGKYTGSCVGVDRTTGNLLNMNQWPKTNGRINAIISDGSGGIIIAGDFTRVGDSARKNLARINSSGQVTALKADIDQTVKTVLLQGGNVYIGGQFSTVNGSTRSMLASINLSTSALNSWNPGGTGYSVNSLVTDGTTLYAGGDFYNFNSVSRQDIAAFDLSTGSLTTLNMPVNPTGSGYVNVLLVHGGKLYAGGDFSSFGGMTRNYAAAIDLTSRVVTGWNPNCNGYVYSMTARNDTIYLGGVFTQAGGSGRMHIASVNATSGTATTWNPHVAYPGNVQSLTIADNTVYAGGYFYQVGSFYTNHFAAINIATAAVSNLNLTTYEYYADVTALYVSGNTIYLGGKFASLGGVERQSFAALDLKNNKLLPLDFKFEYNTNIKTIKIDNGILHLGGLFTSFRYGGTGLQNRTNLVSFDIANQYALTTWNPLSTVTLFTPYDDIKTLEITPNYYYMGGEFGFTIGTTTYNNVIRVNRTTGAIDTWQPSFRYNSTLSDFSVSALSSFGNRMYMGGAFGLPSNQFTGNFMYFDFPTNTNAYAQYNGSVNVIKRMGNRIYLGGGFYGIGGTTGNGAIAVDTSAGALGLNWRPNIDGFVNDLVISKDKIYLGGYFMQAGGKARGSFAVVDTVKGGLWPWSPHFEMSNVFTWTSTLHSGTPVRKIFAAGDTVFVAGDFEDVSGKNITGLARFHFDNYQLPNVKISASANPACAGSNVLFSAATNISSASFEWKVNGVVSGSAQAYNYAPSNGDIITCKIRVSGTGCYVRDTAIDTFIIQVDPVLTPTISITGPAKQVNGWNVTINAAVNNAGSTYSIDWKNNGTTFNTTMNTPTIIYSKGAGTDNITATITPTGGCYNTAISNTLTIQENVGVKDVAPAGSISVYPNPVKEVINIKGLNTGDRIELTDMLGRKLQQWTAGADEKDQQFAVGQLQKGHYMLKILDKNGNTRTSQPVQK